MSETPVEDFIDRWSESGASERSNYQPFLIELCELLGVDRPDPAGPDTRSNDYVFERRVDYRSGQEGERGFIDLYKSGHFVLEAKQGSEAPVESEAERLGVSEPQRSVGTARRDRRQWERAMERAKNQARRYARGLPDDEGWPPFLIVVDVGYCIDLYSDFARQGKYYSSFPNPESYRIYLEDLTNDEVRDRLRRVFADPLSLDPTRHTTRVTQDLAGRLGQVASSMEDGGHDSAEVSGFLMRCLFTMFAEDVGLLPQRSFTELLESYRGNLQALPKALESLWATMEEGGFEPGLRTDVQEFNGGLFAEHGALPVSEAELEILIQAAEADWSEVEPAIFGTLLERALDPRERHKMGAHFTPRGHVERLVVPTVIEPLREEWDAVQTAAAKLESDGEKTEAREAIKVFHRRLCEVQVLDPACGSGNFLYVTLEHLKRLEAEVLSALESYGGQQEMDMTGGYRVSPGQLKGLEVNPRAAAIAEVVIWIGYLQWHFRTYGDAERLDPPILENLGNIEQRDAILDYDEKTPRTDGNGDPVTRWDGRTYKKHPNTGEAIPDESAQIPVYDYENPEPAEWPEVDFIVGNPPFVGNKRMRKLLGQGYTEAVREAYRYKVPKSVDFVMYWWYKASKAVRGKLEGWDGSSKQFGLITTNSIRQDFNRRVVEKQMKGSPSLSISFAIPDHPWVDSRKASDVRISMTTGGVSDRPGTLQTVVREEQATGTDWEIELAEKNGTILADLTIGADITGTEKLVANEDLSYRGVSIVGRGFVVSKEKARKLGLGKLDGLEDHIREYRHGRDLTQSPRRKMVIDLYGLEVDEVRDRFPRVFQHVLDRVKPERMQKDRERFRERWWEFGWPRPEMREAVQGLDRYIATPYVSKHHFLQFLEASMLPDDALVVIASDDAFHLGVLSSRIHEIWALAAGGNLGVGNDPQYNNTQCFDPYPFPSASGDQRTRIRELGQQIDAHRKKQINSHDDLTMTALYNVLEKERSKVDLNDEEREIHNQGLVGVLKDLHDELDTAVARAYGWDPGLPEEEILQRLVDLNAERRAEEEQGYVRYLRPEYQAPEEVETQAELELDVEISGEGGPAEPFDWPPDLKARAQAVRTVMTHSDGPLTVEEVAQHFHRARRDDVRELLETLASLGHVEEAEGGEFTT